MQRREQHAETVGIGTHGDPARVRELARVDQRLDLQKQHARALPHDRHGAARDIGVATR